MSRRRLALALAPILALTGCKDGKDPAGRGEPAASTPKVALSQQPWRQNPESLPAPAPAGSGSMLDGREEAAGYKMHADAANGCNGDKKCIGTRCGPLCTSWMNETYKTFRSVNQRNEVYFACLGACLAGPDGGK